MLGQLVMEIKPESNIEKIDISNMQSGVYFIKVVFADEEFTHKLVKK
ncbi:MAG: hypothetical protein C0596_05040 [Marinilabiliales bacterium]|nr:MAG: hypothetical protein C0596_05040 [Marinilabiliales bacterium]